MISIHLKNFHRWHYHTECNLRHHHNHRYIHLHHHTCNYHYLIHLSDSYGESFQFLTRLVYQFPATSLGANMHTLKIYRYIFCLICGVQREDLDMFEKNEVTRSSF